MGLGYEAEIPAERVALVVTSPPYWHIKGYGVSNQIGYGQNLHEYLYNLSRVWREKRPYCPCRRQNTTRPASRTPSP